MSLALGGFWGVGRREQWLVVAVLAPVIVARLLLTTLGSEEKAFAARRAGSGYRVSGGGVRHAAGREGWMD